MRWALWLFIILTSGLAVCEECTTFVTVNAFDHKTNLNLHALTAADLEARLGTLPLAVVSAEPMPMNRILVLIETSGSEEDSKISGLVTDTIGIVKQAPDGLPIAVGIFSEKALFTSAFFPNAQQRNASIDEIAGQAKSLGRHTALYDALHEALARFGQHQPGDTVLLVSDGFDNKSKRSDGDLEKELLAQGTRLLILTRPQSTLVKYNFLQFNAYEDTSSWRSTPGKWTLMRLAGKTGGAHIGRLSSKSFWEASTAFLVGIKPPPDLKKPKIWKLDVRNSVNWTNGKPLLWYPEQLPPCSNGK